MAFAKAKGWRTQNRRFCERLGLPELRSGNFAHKIFDFVCESTRTRNSVPVNPNGRYRKEDMAELVDATDLKIEEPGTLLSALKAI